MPSGHELITAVHVLSDSQPDNSPLPQQWEAAGQTGASEQGLGSALVVKYIEGRNEPQDEQETIVQQLLRRVLHLEARLEANLEELQSSHGRAAQLQHTVEVLRADNEQLQQTIRRLEIGFRRHISERVSADQLKLALGSNGSVAESAFATTSHDGQGHVVADTPADDSGQGPNADTQTSGSEPDDCGKPPKKRDRHGRRRIDVIPEIIIETLPAEVIARGLDNFERIGEEDTRTLGHRRGGPVELVLRRVKFVERTQSAGAPEPSAASSPATSQPASNDSDGSILVREHEVAMVPQDTAFRSNPFVDGAIVRYTPEPTNDSAPAGPVLIAPMHERPIDRCLADPGLLARLLVHKLDYHTPYYRQQVESGRLGWPISRANMARWQYECGSIAMRITDAMWQDGLQSSWFGMDATGTAIRANKELRYGYVFVLVAPGDSVLFRFCPKYDGATVRELFGGYQATIVADASANHNVLFGPGKNREAGCWSHARKPFVKALAAGEGQGAAFALQIIQSLFRIEQGIALCSADQRLVVRQRDSAPLVDRLLEWGEQQLPLAAQGSFLRAGLVYLRNQKLALREFLSNGEIPIHNNASERALRRIVKGRRNWLFHASDEHAQRSCAISSLIASCDLHGLDPELYLQEILTVAPCWSLGRMIELCPKNWVATRQRLIAEGRLKYLDLASLSGSRFSFRTARA